MPPRSNAFQRLIRDIHEQLAPGATVTESAMLTDLVSGDLREVDVTLRTSAGGYEFVLSIECHDRSRPATVEWVEQVIAKHSSLPTNKLVLVSRSGFTKSAKEKAARSGVETYSLEEAQSVDWTRLIHLVNELRIETLKISIDVFVYIVEPASVIVQQVSETARLSTADGKHSATVGEVFDYFLVHSNLKKVLRKKHAALNNKPAEFDIGLDCAPGVTFTDPNVKDGAPTPTPAVFFEGRSYPHVIQREVERATFKGGQLIYLNEPMPWGEVTFSSVETEKSLTARISYDESNGRRKSWPVDDPNTGLAPTTAETMWALIHWSPQNEESGDLDRAIQEER